MSTSLEKHAQALQIANYLYLAHIKECALIKEYIAQRQLPIRTLNRFGVGYAEDDFRSLVDHYTSKSMRDTAVSAGLIREAEKNGRYYDTLRGRMTFPIHNTDGQIVGFGARAIPNTSSTKEFEDGGKPAKYLNSEESTYFKKSELLYGLHQSLPTIKNNSTAIVVEGYLDVIRLHDTGFTNAVAPLGTAFTAQQFNLLKEQGVKTIYFCFDSDSAGQRAAVGAAETMLANSTPWMQAYFVDLKGLDPDDFILQHGSAAFEQQIQSAKGIVDFLSDSVASRIDMSTMEGLAHYAHEMRGFILKSAGVLQSDLIGRVEEVTGYLTAEHIAPEVTVRGVVQAHTEEELLIARLWVAGQIDDEMLAQFSETYTNLYSDLQEGSDLHMLGQSLGAIPEHELENCCAQLEQLTLNKVLAESLESFRHESYDNNKRQEIKSMMNLSFS